MEPQSPRENLGSSLIPAIAQQTSPLARLDTSAASIQHSFDLAVRPQIVALSRAKASTDHKIADSDGKIIDAVHFLAHVAQKEDPETGELLQLPRLVIVDSHGERWETFSEITLGHFGFLVALCGRPPWNPPVPLMVVRHKGRVNGHWCSLELSEQLEAQADALKVAPTKRGK